MKSVVSIPGPLILLIVIFINCNPKMAFSQPVKKEVAKPSSGPTSSVPLEKKDFKNLLAEYQQFRFKLYPLEATAAGFTDYNGQLRIDISPEFIEERNQFLKEWLGKIKQFPTDKLTESDLLSKEILLERLENELATIGFPFELMPFNQMGGIPLTLAQYGSGESDQPFRTEKDYFLWLERAAAFPKWTEAALRRLKEGMEKKIVLPATVVEKMAAQMADLVQPEIKKSVFFKPVLNFPASFKPELKQDLETKFNDLITTKLNPSYELLANFLKSDYQEQARKTAGLAGLDGGRKIYSALVKAQTTTNLNPEVINRMGFQEVARIRAEMEKVKLTLGSKAPLKDFFEQMRSDPKLMPFKKPEEVLDAYRKVEKAIEPNLNRYFSVKPKTPFEIRRTEAYREASASPQYFQASLDGKRPGIFFVPVVDATKYNRSFGIEAVFLHEAIPGHHYQISLQQENTSLPLFRQIGADNAYVEGWALYCESLGKELGVYKDGYEYMGALGKEMHRALRLVIDYKLHYEGISEEMAINYMLENEPVDLQVATAEVERYMVWPGQALGYKIGALKIAELRNKYQKQLGPKFKIAAFHYELLKDGSMPLSVLEKKMDRWASSVK